MRRDVSRRSTATRSKTCSRRSGWSHEEVAQARRRVRRRQPGRAGADRPDAQVAARATASATRAASSRRWDRCKYTLLLGGLFVFYWWQKIDDNPIKSVNDAFWETVREQAWILVLLALEWIRQIHFLIAEHSARYYHFWKVRVFGRFEGRSERLDPWTRYRVARVLRWIFALVVRVGGGRPDHRPEPDRRHGQPARAGSTTRCRWRPGC